MPSIHEALAIVQQHLQAEELQLAEAVCQKILAVEPLHAEAHRQLGNVLRNQGRIDAAVTCYQRSLELQDNSPEVWNELGRMLQTLGRWDEAVACYQRVVEQLPASAEARFNLGNAFHGQRRFREAATQFQRAFQLNPHFAEAYLNLGAVLQDLGRMDDAITCYGLAIQCNPNLANAHYNMGIAQNATQRWDEAVACFERAIQLRPDFAAAYNNLGATLKEIGRLDEAIAYHRQALQIEPASAQGHYNLGIAFKEKGRWDEAIASFRRALQLKPDFVEANNNLGSTLQDEGHLPEAVVCFRTALQSKPDFVAVLNNLGNALKDLGELDEAVECFQKAIRLSPAFAKAYANLGTALNVQGRVAEAADYYRRALRLQPRADVHSNFLLCLVYDATIPQETVYAEHVQWAERYGRTASPWGRHPNLPDLDRRLRIGYLSADFRGHAVSCFIEPILRCHDHEHFEIFCYANNVMRDEVTERLQKSADHWRWIAGLNDDALEQTIRSDQIDILVELSGHSAGNRLTALARKPAPLQVTYIGYPATTGLAAIDYRFTDEVLNPDNEPSYHVERLYRPPCGSACFVPRSECPEVAELPAKTRGFLTFGAPHNLAKLNAGVYDLWTRILHALPTARLVLFREALRGQAARLVREQFTQRGIADERLDLLCHATSTHGYHGYMSKYHDIDICLDTFPANAGTTACESLWMGVPSLTLYGDRFFGRQTASVLSRLGLPDWTSRSPDELLDKAIYWNGHIDELAELRRCLRPRFCESSLGDPVKYTRGIEAAYRDIWTRWCKEQVS